MESTALIPSTSLALAPTREVTPAILEMINQIAPVMHRSRLFGVTSVESAAAIMLKGHELGLGITASFELVQVVQGKPGLSPRGAMALLLNSPKIKQIKITRVEHGGKYEGHECYMQRDNGFEYSVRFTLEDARKANLIKPDSGWEKYPENMCQWRAIGFCADVVAPDIVAGMTSIMKMPEQFGVAISSEGDIIDVQSSPSAPTQEVTEPETVQVTLDELVTLFGADKVMEANGGIIPMTTEQVAAVAQKLAEGVGA